VSYDGPRSIGGRLYYIRKDTAQIPGDCQGKVWRLDAPSGFILEDRSVWEIQLDWGSTGAPKSAPSIKRLDDQDMFEYRLGPLLAVRWNTKSIRVMADEYPVFVLAEGDTLQIRRSRAPRERVETRGQMTRIHSETPPHKCVNTQLDQSTDVRFLGWLVPEEDVPAAE